MMFLSLKTVEVLSFGHYGRFAKMRFRVCHAEVIVWIVL